MKLIFSALILFTLTTAAQPKIVKQAVITTITNVIAPEEEDVSQVQNQGSGGGGFNFRTMMDGETKSTTFLKNEFVKTNLKSETIKASIYRNNITKITNTVFEMMGSKQGIVASDDDQVAIKKKVDSMMDERAKTDSTIKRRTKTVDFSSTVSYTEETKKIADHICKKAYIITDKLIQKDSLAVWYCPEFKFENVSATGGMNAIPGMRGMGGGNAKDNFEKVDGFVMMYERKMPRGRIMEVKVTKIELGATVADKEFDLPKDIEFKNAKEMMGNGQGGGRIIFNQR